MKLVTVTIQMSYNAKLHGDDEKTLRQGIEDLYFPGLIKTKLDFLGLTHLADNLIVDVSSTEH